jgi:hypothetical protein
MTSSYAGRRSDLQAHSIGFPDLFLIGRAAQQPEAIPGECTSVASGIFSCARVAPGEECPDRQGPEMPA